MSVTQQTRQSDIDIVGLGIVRLAVQVPPGFKFTQLSDSFEIAPSSGRAYLNKMYVFVTPSAVVIPRPLPDGERINRPLGSTPARWWIYDLGHVAGGRFHRFADLLTGINGCDNFVRIGVQIFGDDERKIDILMRAAADMRIEAPLKLADADSVAAKCAGLALADRP